MIDQTNYLGIGYILRNEVFGDSILFLVAGILLIFYASSLYKIDTRVPLVISIIFVLISQYIASSSVIIVTLILIVSMMVTLEIKKMWG